MEEKQKMIKTNILWNIDKRLSGKLCKIEIKMEGVTNKSRELVINRHCLVGEKYEQKAKKCLKLYKN